MARALEKEVLLLLFEYGIEMVATEFGFLDTFINSLV